MLAFFGYCYVQVGGLRIAGLSINDKLRNFPLDGRVPDKILTFPPATQPYTASLNA